MKRIAILSLLGVIFLAGCGEPRPAYDVGRAVVEQSAPSESDVQLALDLIGAAEGSSLSIIRDNLDGRLDGVPDRVGELCYDILARLIEKAPSHKDVLTADMMANLEQAMESKP